MLRRFAAGALIGHDLNLPGPWADSVCVAVHDLSMLVTSARMGKGGCTSLQTWYAVHNALRLLLRVLLCLLLSLRRGLRLLCLRLRQSTVRLLYAWLDQTTVLFLRLHALLMGLLACGLQVWLLRLSRPELLGAWLHVSWARLCIHCCRSS